MKTSLNVGKSIVAFFTASLVAAASAHSPAETNEVVAAMLGRVLYFASDNWVDNVGISRREAPVTWPGFLGRDESHGWTLMEKKAAFDWYLSTLGTNDCKALRGDERRHVHVAVDQCRVLNYVEAAAPLKALALNTNGIYRNEAIKLVVKFNPVDSHTTSFVEMIVTNSAGYSFRERGAASDKYAWKLFALNATNHVQREARESGIEMFYRNRFAEAVATPMVDELFTKYITGYALSSNRLTFATNAFTYPICEELFGDYFTSVTNQLLSSGQPLPWINVGGGN